MTSFIERQLQIKTIIIGILRNHLSLKKRYLITGNTLLGNVLINCIKTFIIFHSVYHCYIGLISAIPFLVIIIIVSSVRVIQQ